MCRTWGVLAVFFFFNTFLARRTSLSPTSGLRHAPLQLRKTNLVLNISSMWMNLGIFPCICGHAPVHLTVNNKCLRCWNKWVGPLPCCCVCFSVESKCGGRADPTMNYGSPWGAMAEQIKEKIYFILFFNHPKPQTRINRFYRFIAPP